MIKISTLIMAIGVTAGLPIGLTVAPAILAGVHVSDTSQEKELNSAISQHTLDRIDEINKAVTDLGKELEALQKTNAESQAQQEILDKKIEAIEDKINNLIAESTSIITSIDGLKSENTELDASIVQLVSAMSSLLTTVTAIDSENKTLNSSIVQISKDVADAVKSAADLETKNTALKSTLNALDAAIKALEKRIEDLEKEVNKPIAWWDDVNSCVDSDSGQVALDLISKFHYAGSNDVFAGFGFTHSNNSSTLYAPTYYAGKAVSINLSTCIATPFEGSYASNGYKYDIAYDGKWAATGPAGSRYALEVEFGILAVGSSSPSKVGTSTADFVVNESWFNFHYVDETTAYALSSSTGTLVRINPSTGTFTKVGSSNADSVINESWYNFTYVNTTTAYAVSSTSGVLVKINPTNGTFTRVGSTSNADQVVASSWWHQIRYVSSTLAYTMSNDGHIVSVNPTTGEFKRVGTKVVSDIISGTVSSFQIISSNRLAAVLTYNGRIIKVNLETGDMK